MSESPENIRRLVARVRSFRLTATCQRHHPGLTKAEMAGLFRRDLDAFGPIQRRRATSGPKEIAALSTQD